MTYAELNAAANKAARVFQRRGVQPGDRVGLAVPRSIDGIVALYGVLKAGAALVPLDPAYPAERLKYMAESANVALMVTSAEIRPSVSGFLHCPQVELETLASSSRSEDESNLDLPASEQDLLYIIFTSGSTGNPKGVAMPHGPLINLCQWQATYLGEGLPRAARTLQFTTLSFDVAYQEIFCTACEGGTLVLMAEELRYDPARLWRYLQETGIHRLFLPFVALHQMAESVSVTDLAGCSLRQIITAGEQLQSTPAIRSLLRALPQARLHNHYGPSETHVATAFELPSNPDDWTALPSIGKPVANTNVYLLDDAGAEVQPGDSGELFISGACLAHGYFGRDDLTRERFVTLTLAGNPPTRAYRTGDLARLSPGGTLECLGRKDHQVKIRGHRVEPGEIEAVLAGHPAIKACVVAAFGEGPERQLAAYASLKPGFTVDASELRTHLRARLAEYLVPVAYVFLDSLPLTPSGKVDRRSLPLPGPRPLEQTATLASRENPLEQAIGEIWQNILKIGPFDREASFFDLGGHSLLLARVHKALEQALERSFSILDLFRHPTLRSLAAFLAEKSGTPMSGAKSDAPRVPRHRPVGHEPIAIVGMAGRWPGAPTVRDLWQALCDGLELTTEFTHEELVAAGANPALLKEEGYVRRRGFLPGVDYFDASFFSFTAKDAEITDPQQRLFLECSWEALEDAGLDAHREPRRVGVYAGSSLNTYFLHHVLPTRARVEQFTHAFQVDHYPLLVGNDKDYLATRVAYKLNLRGPALTVQTACSTSLVAVSQACAGLLSGHCEVALAGGVSISFPQQRGYVYQEGAIASSDGRCRAFDVSATGTVFGAGAGVVVLKRLSTAIEDGDRIYAVIRGCGVNNDGSDKASFSAPSIQGQSEAIASALEQAEVSAESIGYVEAHGTGTPLGDPIEVAALTQAFRQTTERRQFCILGSIKPNLGHLESAAGVTGLIKATLALHHERIPGTLHFRAPNLNCGLAESPFRVTADVSDWKRETGARRAGVSSFGVGGTNAHVILEEAPVTQPAVVTRPAELLLLSARTPTALERTSTRWMESLQNLTSEPSTPTDFANAAHTSRLGRRAFDHRRVVIAESASAAAEALASRDPKRVFQRSLQGKARSVVFLFPGQGTQYPGMGRQLYATEPVFKSQIDRCCEILKPGLGMDLSDVLLPSPGSEASAAERLRGTSLAQPALFCIEYALATLWRSWGIEPSALIGHSVGEYVAAVVAGVMTVEQALDLLAVRGRLMQDLPGGAMLSVRASVSDVERWITESVSISAINSPRSCVVSGPYSEIEGVERSLTAAGIPCKRLHTSHAFHSSMMDPMLADFGSHLKQHPLRRATIPIVSTRTGTWIKPEDWSDHQYWLLQVRECVHFSKAISTIGNEPGVVLLEIGPGQTLSALAAQTLPGDGRHVVIPSMPPVENRAETSALLTALGRLWLEGVPVNWRAFDEGKGLAKSSCPTYPFEKQRYWADVAPANSITGLGVVRESEPVKDLPRRDVASPSANDVIEQTIRRQLSLMQQQLEALESAEHPSVTETITAQARTIL